jgi:uncharacterized protein
MKQRQVIQRQPMMSKGHSVRIRVRSHATRGQWWSVFVCGGLVLLPALATAAESRLGPAPIVRNSESPFAKLQSVDLPSVRWTDGFWADRYRQTAGVTLRTLWELADDPKGGHVLENFRIAAGLKEGQFAGTDWQDEWLYKWLEAAASIYRVTGDPWIDARMDEAIDLIAKAQQADGYIATQITVRKKPRYQEPREHEVYNMGHLITAGVVHHRMTGKDSLLAIAVRAADHLCETLGVTVDPHFAHNPSAVMGLIELYRETGQRRYLDCASRIVDRRGTNPKRGGMFAPIPGIGGTDQIQDRVPLRKAQELVGHNVFFTYLFAGAADVYQETGDESLKAALRRMWLDLVQHKMCINGGCSPMGLGISSGYPVNEAVGPAYFLPSASAYNETCGQIGVFLWNYRMLCAEENAAYADIMELELYNGFLGGIGLDGESWFYRNPLRRYDRDHQETGHNEMPQRAQPGLRQVCCPSNLLRTLAQLQAYFYSVADSGIWIHHYGGNAFDGSLPDGSRLQLTQETQYPWDGKVVVRIDAIESSRPLTIRLRIPGWAEGATLALNGNPVGEKPSAGSYVGLTRQWATGDRIELNLPMPVRLMQAHPKAEQLRNQIAVMRGPLLYCLESPDLPDDAEVHQVYLPSDVAFEPQQAEGLPMGIIALQGRGLVRLEPSWEGSLYRPVGDHPLKPMNVHLIPYFAWANRGPSAMSVWLPLLLKD